MYLTDDAFVLLRPGALTAEAVAGLLLVSGPAVLVNMPEKDRALDRRGRSFELIHLLVCQKVVKKHPKCMSSILSFVDTPISGCLPARSMAAFLKKALQHGADRALAVDAERLLLRQ